MDALIVSRAEAGQKLLNFLSRRVDAGSSELHKWIRSGQVRVNGGRAKAFDRVGEGDAVRVPPFAALREVKHGESGPRKSGMKDAAEAVALQPPKDNGVSSDLSVLYEDDNLLVLNKSAGLPSQDGSGHADSVASRLARAYADADFIPALVHRLDKDTSGLLLAGKSYAAVRRLTDALAGREGEPPVKEYLAWVWGRWPHTAMRELRDNLDKNETARRMRVGAEEGRNALSLAAPVTIRETRDGDVVSLLRVRLVTGRTHQIRVQLAARAFPLVGDSRYGNARRDARARVKGLKLHACRLLLPPPWNRALEAAPDWAAPWDVPEAASEAFFSGSQPQSCVSA